MKLLKGLLSLFALAALVTFYTGCDKSDPKKSPEQEQIEKLASSWNLTNAVSGTNRTEDFSDLVLTITGSFASDGGTYEYSFTGERPNPSPWKANGTWKFGENPTTDLIRDPNSALEIPMTYTLSGSELNIEFVIPEGYDCCPGSTGRVSSVEGTWSFTFVKVQ